MLLKVARDGVVNTRGGFVCVFETLLLFGAMGGVELSTGKKECLPQQEMANIWIKFMIRQTISTHDLRFVVDLRKTLDISPWFVRTPMKNFFTFSL